MTNAETRRSFPCVATSAGQARRFVDGALADADMGHLSYAATVLVSELVANAVLHSGTPIEVAVRRDGNRIRVAVYDGSEELPVRKHYSTMSGTGRGLVLVDRMSATWGADRTPGGKVVWFELDGRAQPLFDIVEADSL